MQIGRAAVSTMNGAPRNVRRAICRSPARFRCRCFEIGWIAPSQRMARFVLCFAKQWSETAQALGRARKITRIGRRIHDV
jgi:hypothetical protein